jgi:hypothetical protein
VLDVDGNILGRVEPKIGQRLAELIESGNQYIAAVVQSDPRQVRILIREIFQTPSQQGRTSFPGRLIDGSMYDYLSTRYDYDAEELLDEDDVADERQGIAEEFVSSDEDSNDDIALEDIEKNISDDEENEE